MALKAQNAGLFGIPTLPSAGTGVVQSGSANTYGNFVTVQASGALGALYLTGVAVNVTTSSSLHTGKYCAVQVATGASGSETVVGAVTIPTPGVVPATNAKYGGFRDFDLYPIPVAANTRIACKTASDTAAAIVWNVNLKAILQADVGVDTNFNENVNVINIGGTAQTARDIGASVLLSSGTGTGQVNLGSGVVEANVMEISSAAVSTTSAQLGVNVVNFGGTAVTGRDLGASVLLSSGTGSGQIVLNSGAVAVSSGTITSVSSNVSGSVASVTSNVAGNVTGSVGSVTGLTASNLDATISSRMATYTQPTGFLTATFPSTVASPTNITAGTITSVSSNVAGSVGSVVGLTASNLDATISSRSTYGGTDTSGTTTLLTRLSSDRATNLDTAISSRLASTDYTAPDNTSITAIKAKTDSLTFTVANNVDSNIKVVNDVTVTGTGSSSDPWGP